MADPLGFIGGGASGAHGPGAISPVGPGANRNAKDAGGPSFRDTLMRNIDQVNELQQDATRAVEDAMWQAGRCRATAPGGTAAVCGAR